MNSPGSDEIHNEVTVNGNSPAASTTGECNGPSVMPTKNAPCDLPPTDDPELDALLDDALKDFDKPILQKQKKAPPPENKAAELMMDSVWAEEFIKQATNQFEQKMRECLKSSLTAGSNCSKTQQQLEEHMSTIVDAASTAALNTTTDPEALSSQLNEAIRNTAKKVTESSTPSSATNMSGIPDDAEFARLMGGLGMGMDDDHLDDSDMNEILPFMTNMMQKLLSKELLQPVLTDIVTKYPSWLADNREKLPPSQYEKYSQQYEYMKNICEEYASEKEADSSEVKKKRFEKISDLMLKVQYAGPPPSELIGEVDGGNPLPAFDAAGGDQCSVM